MKKTIDLDKMAVKIYNTEKTLYNDLGHCHPKLSRGQVWCTTCGKTKKVNSGECLAKGWPKCCGYTMTLDSPEERTCKQN